LIAPLSENEIARNSYQLFHVIMQAPISLTYSQEKKWEASRLTIHGAYKWEIFLPWVEDPQDILIFLECRLIRSPESVQRSQPMFN